MACTRRCCCGSRHRSALLAASPLAKALHARHRLAQPGIRADRQRRPLNFNVGPCEGGHAEVGAISSRQRYALAAAVVVCVTASRCSQRRLLPKHFARGIVSPNPSFERTAKGGRSISTLGALRVGMQRSVQSTVAGGTQSPLLSWFAPPRRATRGAASCQSTARAASSRPTWHSSGPPKAAAQFQR